MASGLQRASHPRRSPAPSNLHLISNTPAVRTYLPARGEAKVRRLPRQASPPLWLRWLIHLQKGSAIVAIGLGIAVSIAYCSTVYIQQLWAKEYRTLKQLERNQRQMTTVKEVLKDQMAQQAEAPETGMSQLSPQRLIFVPPAPTPSPPAASTPSAVPTPAKVAPALGLPLGY